MVLVNPQRGPLVERNNVISTVPANAKFLFFFFFSRWLFEGVYPDRDPPDFPFNENWNSAIFRYGQRARNRALPTAEDLIACDRITLYSTKFAAFIKSPLRYRHRGRGGSVYPAASSGPALSKCTLFEDPATRPSPNFNAARGGLWLPIFPGKRFLLEFRSPTANGEPLWWRTDVFCVDLA